MQADIIGEVMIKLLCKIGSANNKGICVPEASNSTAVRFGKIMFDHVAKVGMCFYKVREQHGSLTQEINR